MQDTTFARAKRGDLPHELTLEDITRLSSASLDAPHGACENNDPLLLRLHRLVTAGLLVATRTEQAEVPVLPALMTFRRVAVGSRLVTRHFVRGADLRPHLADLGEVGPLLHAWIMAGVEPATVASRPAEPWFMPRVQSFCEAIMASGEIDPDNPGFTARDLAVALGEVGLWHRPGEATPAPDTLRGYTAKGSEKFFVFSNGSPGGSNLHRHGQAVRRLVSLYERHTGAAANPEPGNHAPTVPASNFRKASGL